MKNLFFIAFFLCCHAFNAQQLSDYKYLYVPQNIKGFEDNKYDLNSTLVKKLQAKGYLVIQKEQAEWPLELRQNPCEVAVVNILDTGNFFKNKLTFEAKDCRDKLIVSQQGVSNEKEFDKGLNESLQKSLATIPNSSPVENGVTIKEVIVEKTQADNILSKETAPVGKIKEVSEVSTSKNYANGNLIFQKVLIGDKKFILVNQNSSIPYATFTESTKAGVFRVVLENGSMTLGYLENGDYIIEIPDKSGEFRREIFEKK